MRRLPDAAARGRAITIDLEGEAVPAVEGEPVAAALIAAGEALLSRSVKYHRPRGAYCFSGACSQCLMRVDGVPNVFACRTPARQGMRVERQNAYPSAKADVFGAIDWMFPRGLDHHAMLAGVPVAEQVMARVARQLAGLGLLPEREAPRRLPTHEIKTRVAVAGGGAAGLAAADVLGARGVPFLLFERDKRQGGCLAVGAPQPEAPPLPDLEALPSTALRCSSVVLGLYEDEAGRFLLVLVYEPEGARLNKVYAERFLLAVGGHPTLLPFENNDLPGVYSGRAASLLARAHGVLPRTAALVGHGPELYGLAQLYAERGTQLRALVDLRGPLPADAPEPSCLGSEPKAHGLGKVRGFSFTPRGGKRRKVACEAVVVCLPPSPAFELARQGGARVEFDPAREAFVVMADADGRTQAPDVYAAGDLVGTLDASSAAEGGRRAAAALVESLS